eukprot:15337372-Ditylum_brightwellii.AAC.2
MRKIRRENTIKIKPGFLPGLSKNGPPGPTGPGPSQQTKVDIEDKVPDDVSTLLEQSSQETKQTKYKMRYMHLTQEEMEPFGNILWRDNSGGSSLI